jgi:Domain of unknown function (DUF4234)
MNMQKPSGPLGNKRGIGFGILMTIVTFGIYTYWWSYATLEELKQHRNGQGIGGVIALILMFVGGGIAIPFFAGSEVGNMYAEDGQEKPVTGHTGWWILLPIAGAIIWFVKVQRALNRYWESKSMPAVEVAPTPAT